MFIPSREFKSTIFLKYCNMDAKPLVAELYGKRVRVRACGLLVVDDQLLLANHRSLAAGDFWSPPGGGVEFGESAEASLKREFYEETGLDVKVLDFLFAYEFIQLPLHAVELFFTVEMSGGTLRTGNDPEMNADEQLIQSVKFLTWDSIGALAPEARHGIFNAVAEPSDITRLTGYVAR